MSDKKKINYLVGKSAKLNISLFPFNKIIVEFLDDLSKNLNYFNKPNFTDIKAFSHYCSTSLKNHQNSIKNALSFIKIFSIYRNHVACTSGNFLCSII